MKKKLLNCILIIMLIIPFIYNYCYADDGELNNSIRGQIFYVPIKWGEGDQYTNYDFWEIGIGNLDPYDTKSSEVLKAVKSAGESKYGSQAAIIFARYVIWLNKQEYQNLAKQNDENYLKIGQLTLEAGEKLIRTRSQDSTADGSLNFDNRSVFDQSLDIFKNRGKEITVDNMVKEEELGDVLKDYITNIERNKKRFNAATDYKKGNNTKLQDSYAKKLKYTTQEKVDYLKKYGVRLNISDPDREVLKQVWAYGLNGELSDLQKVNFGIPQIKAFIKMKGSNTDYGNDSVIQEWYNMMKNNKHTEWYNKNIENGQFKKVSGGQYTLEVWNEKLTDGKRNEMIQELKNCMIAAQWTTQEKNDAENILLKISDYGSDISYYQTTGQHIDTVVEGNEEIGLQNYGNKEDGGTGYAHPKVSKTDETMNVDETMKNAETFILKDDGDSNNNIDSTQLSELFNPIYNIAVVIGIIVAVVVGAILGIKFMIGSVEQQADVKKLLIPYVAGCVAVFGAFAIWKIVVTILAGM